MTDILIAPRGVNLATEPQVSQPAQPVSTPMTWKRRLVRFGILGVVLAAVGIAAAVLPLQEIADGFARLGPAAAVLMAVVGGLLLSVLVPRTAITLACGAVLGAATGAATALAAAIIAAAATYYAGRWVGRGALAARTGGKLQRLDGWLNRRGLSAVLLVRFLPLAPFGLVGYAYGTTSVCRKRYLLGTTLASIPSAISYAVIGAAVVRPGEMSVFSLAPALIGFTLTTSIVFWWKRSAKKAAAAEAAAA
ncbi:VTT domain-containing protein [Actinoplanes bogorensis]|uniref:TVP38/TMEM64 family membrane protein n=1 Tax=Paractinoplanes bogorensis TaxID=1610840 RepID=A0ABS5YQQ6_9ACTN|nr:VTT domain-containing protein [Actinoplanes bogorensis]MBU2665671.1 VTT domain-containing protein [Actinoplanes bogorensis]